MTLQFFRYSERPSARKYASAHPDEIVIGRYEGSDQFEFIVELHRFNGGSDAIRVCVFDDAFVAFTDCVDFFRWLSEVQPKTLDKVQAWLEGRGFENSNKTLALPQKGKA